MLARVVSSESSVSLGMSIAMPWGRCWVLVASWKVNWGQTMECVHKISPCGLDFVPAWWLAYSRTGVGGGGGGCSQDQAFPKAHTETARHLRTISEASATLCWSNRLLRPAQIPEGWNQMPPLNGKRTEGFVTIFNPPYIVFSMRTPSTRVGLYIASHTNGRFWPETSFHAPHSSPVITTAVDKGDTVFIKKHKHRPNYRGRKKL